MERFISGAQTKKCLSGAGQKHLDIKIISFINSEGKMIENNMVWNEQHKEVTCPKCDGEGIKDGVSCPNCNGEGSWVEDI